VPRVPPLGGSHHWGRVAPPIAALSGSPPKAPGSAGGYLLLQIKEHVTVFGVANQNGFDIVAIADFHQPIVGLRL
jgi:hypothetical protein